MIGRQQSTKSFSEYRQSVNESPVDFDPEATNSRMLGETMTKDRFFLSLRWKFAILFGAVFLILHTVFSYLSYLDAIKHFNLDRKNIENTHINITRTLTQDSFLVLEQFAELLPLIGDLSAHSGHIDQGAFANLDDNWSQWQLSWDMESIVFFDRLGNRLKTWGSPMIPADATIAQVLQNEKPAYRLFCSGNCYLQVVIPVIGQSEVIGAFSVIRSFADVIIKYKSETGSDIGLLVADATGIAGSDQSVWPFRLSGLTLHEKNMPIYQQIARKYSLKTLMNQSRKVHFDRSVYEVRIVPVLYGSEQNPPYFLLIDDITMAAAKLNKDLKQVWLSGVISLAASLLLLTIVIHVALHRVRRLANALPMLSENRYNQFRNHIDNKSGHFFGYDELDRLNMTALILTDQLESLEREVRSNTLKVLEKSQELANERDFIKQLIEAAPIIILTQKTNGMILTINQAGVEEFDSDSHSIVGKVFDLFLPEDDWEHAAKLNQLRAGTISGQIQIEGTLVTESGRQRDISWLHKLFKRDGAPLGEAVILTLGVDKSDRNLYEKAILTTTTQDSLTGLSNRKKFREDLAAMIALAQRYNYKVALFYLDLDQFKVINNKNGHESGDKLLMMVANRLKESMRSTDLLSRVDGDEFVIAVSHADTSGIQSIAEKLAGKFKNLIFNFVGKDFELSASIGIAVYPDHAMSVNELFSHAELATGQAKASGRGKYHVYSPAYDYQIKLNRMQYWRDKLENAIAGDRFVLLFQPILCIETSRISHYECLLRLCLEDGHMIMPTDFIVHAEELGLIGQIDRLVLRKAVEKLSELKQQGKECQLTVNLSGRSFNDNTVFEELSGLLRESRVEPEKLIIEITETAAVSNFAAAESLILQIKALGCLLALDDFGVGFSSFYYLKHLPVDYVKIDGSFIRKIHKSEEDKVFVRALSGVAHAFGKKTIAEYVENQQIFDLLKEFKIDYAQGYHVGKPEQSI